MRPWSRSGQKRGEQGVRRAKLARRGDGKVGQEAESLRREQDGASRPSVSRRCSTPSVRVESQAEWTRWGPERKAPPSPPAPRLPVRGRSVNMSSAKNVPASRGAPVCVGMSSQALLAPPAIFQITPRYAIRLRGGAPTQPVLAPEALGDAAVLVVGLKSWRSGSDVATLIPQLRSRGPARPARGTAGRGSRKWTGLAGPKSSGVRGVLFEGEPPRECLRRILTDTTTLPRRNLSGCRSASRACRRRPRPTTRLSMRFGEVGALLGSRPSGDGLATADVRGPGKWLAVAHALRAALRLQAEESAPLLTLAVECGYSDPTRCQPASGARRAARRDPAHARVGNGCSIAGCSAPRWGWLAERASLVVRPSNWERAGPRRFFLWSSAAADVTVTGGGVANAYEKDGATA